MKFLRRFIGFKYITFGFSVMKKTNRTGRFLNRFKVRLNFPDFGNILLENFQEQ